MGKKMRLVLALCVLLIMPMESLAQLNTKVTLSPRIKVGWTFFSGFDYGIELNVGLFTILNVFVIF